MEPVRNHRNRLVVDAARLHRARARRERRQTLLAGSALVSDALAAGCHCAILFSAPNDEDAARMAAEHGLRLVLVDDRALRRLAGTETPRGPVAVVEIPAESLDPTGDVLVSWGVSDPGNAGTLIRTAAAFGWFYAYAPGSADPWGPKTLRAGAGGQFQTGIKSIENLEDLGSLHTVAAVARGGDPPAEVPARPTAVLIGEEAAGLPPDVIAACAQRVTIPTPGTTESLNAAIAAGIVIYELSRRWGQYGGDV